MSQRFCTAFGARQQSEPGRDGFVHVSSWDSTGIFLRTFDRDGNLHNSPQRTAWTRLVNQICTHKRNDEDAEKKVKHIAMLPTRPGRRNSCTL